jgi:hypothetical protein
MTQKKPREWIIGIYCKNGRMFVANTKEEIEKEYAEFVDDFKFITVIEKPKEQNET